MEKDDEEGYQVILLHSPSQVLKVEVVDEEGKTSTKNMELFSEEKSPEKVTDEPEKTSQRRARRRDGKQQKTSERDVSSENQDPKSEEDREKNGLYKCSWKRLYKLYLNKLRSSGLRSVVYSKDKRKEIRNAFKIVCENPEEVITYLLNIVP